MGTAATWACGFDWSLSHLSLCLCLALSNMGKRTREAKAKAALEGDTAAISAASTSAALLLPLQDKDESLDAIFAKTYAPVEKAKPVPIPPKAAAPKPIEEIVKPEKKEKSKKRKAPSPVPRDPNDPEEVYIAKQAAKRLKAAEPAKKTSGSRVVESASEQSGSEIEAEITAGSEEEDSDVEDGQAAAEALAAESDSEPEPSAVPSTSTKASQPTSEISRLGWVKGLHTFCSRTKIVWTKCSL